jgi:REP-associated tyrosine transposase
MRIVTRVTGQVQVSAGGVWDLGYHLVWWPKCRRPMLAGRVAGRCEELIRAKASGHGGRTVALEIMPGHVHLFVKAHRCSPPCRVASQFTGFALQRRAEFPQPPRLSTRWSQLYAAATADAVPGHAVRRCTDVQHERPWRKERAR